MQAQVGLTAKPVHQPPHYTEQTRGTSLTETRMKEKIGACSARSIGGLLPLEPGTALMGWSKEHLRMIQAREGILSLICSATT